MKICNFDLIILFVMMFIVVFVYDQIKNFIFGNKEEFQSTTTGYQADIEAIRNLSSIATQLTLNGGLVVPGALQINNNLSLSGEISIRTGNPSKQVKIGSSQIKFRGDGIAHYGLTNDIDGKFKISNVGNNGEVGVGWINDCIVTDTTGNTTINAKFATNGLNPSNFPTTLSGGIRTVDVYSSGSIVTGNTGTDIKAYINNKGEGMFTGKVDIINNDLFINSIPLTRNNIVGTMTYSGTDNQSVYKPVTIALTNTSPHITVSNTSIKFKYSCLYRIEGNFSVNGYNNCYAGNGNDGNFIFGDISGNFSSIVINQLASSSSDGNDEIVNHFGYYKGKNYNNCTVYPNNNYFNFLILPIVGTEYYLLSKKLKLTGSFVIYAVST